MARTIQLPLDILHLILSHLHGDPESLRNCALTSSSILPPARASLFHHIVLENAGHIDRFSLLLTNSGHIAPFVRSLNIDDRSRSPNLNRPVSLHHPPFTRLRQLQRLVLSAVTLENCEELCLIIATLPTLRCLTCARIVGPPDSNTVGSSSLSPGTALAAAKPPPLTTLTIKQEDLSGPTAISLNPLAAWLSQNDPLSLIHSVELTLRTHDEHVAWLPVLRAVAHNLRSLRITTLEGPVSESANSASRSCTTMYMRSLRTT
ncbi:hypothetical protein C8Q76DRAFT_183010 [Earliella scabrosa]|nr:hypothetical protein C8Q76DRAFT_183010 [Earliella scabrosa]